MSNNRGDDDKIPQDPGNRDIREIIAEFLMCKLIQVELEKANEELSKCIAKLDAKKKAMLELNNQAEHVKAQKIALQKAYDELEQHFADVANSEVESALYESKLVAMHASMIELQKKHEMLCDDMEDIVKNYKAINAELKAFERKVFGMPNTEEPVNETKAIKDMPDPAENPNGAEDEIETADKKPQV